MYTIYNCNPTCIRKSNPEAHKEIIVTCIGRESEGGITLICNEKYCIECMKKCPRCFGIHIKE